MSQTHSIWRRSLSYALGFLSLSAAFITSVQGARAAYVESTFIDELGRQTMMTVAGQNGAAAERVRRLAVIVVHDFDVPTMARFILANYWDRIGDVERDEFVSAFREYLVRTYSRSFGASASQSFAVIDQHVASDTAALVRTRMTQNVTNEAIVIEWLVAKTAYGFRVADMIIAGESLVRTAQAAFAAAINRNGGAVGPLIEQLRKADDARGLWAEETLPQLRTKIAGIAASGP
jgi:phospholipid transport system substrate-binding protein